MSHSDRTAASTASAASATSAASTAPTTTLQPSRAGVLPPGFRNPPRVASTRTAQPASSVSHTVAISGVRPDNLVPGNLSTREKQVLQAAARQQWALDSLGRFVRLAWQLVEPGVDLNENWHIDALASELQLVYPGVRATEPPLGWAPEEPHEGHRPGHAYATADEARAHSTTQSAVPAGGVALVEETWRAWVPEAYRPEPLWRNSKLVINIPPGHMKSLMVSVFWPSWVWLHEPGHRLLSIAGSDTLATRDSMKMRTILDSSWYKGLISREYMNRKRRWLDLEPRLTAEPEDGVPQPRTKQIKSHVKRATLGAYINLAARVKGWQIDTKKDAKASFGTTVGGYREAKAIGSRIIGERGYGWTLDDPVDVKDVLEHGQVDHERVAERCEAVTDVIDKTLMSRLNDKRPGRHYCVIIMQRLHINDPAGAMTRKGWRTVSFRSRYVPDEDLQPDEAPNMDLDPRHAAYTAMRSGADVPDDNPYTGYIGARSGTHAPQPDDVIGAPLFLTMFPESVLTAIEEDELGHEQFNAQHQQNPLPGKGGMLNEALTRARRYPDDPFLVAAGTAGIAAPDGKPLKDLELLMTVDATFGSKSATASNVAVCVMGRPWEAQARGWLFVLDMVAERMSFTETEEAILAMKKKWPRVRTILIEEKANGAALINRLSNQITGIEPYDPRGSKTVRAGVFASLARRGNVWLPAGNPLIRGTEANRHTSWIDPFVMECSRFPGGRRDDQVDAVSMGCIYWTENTPAEDPRDREKKRWAALKKLADDARRGVRIPGFL